MFRPGGLCQLFTEKTKTSRSKCPTFTSPVCKAAVLLVKSHVDSRNAAMSLYQIIFNFIPVLLGKRFHMC